jgi:UDP-N-acetylmuramoyl-L-alanyl-D-glutamate--2,6-diaminopimelate ligase
VFTNLSQDHLDYHRTMEDYFAAKAALFQPNRTEVGVVNADDRWGRRLLEAAPVPMVGYRMADAVDLQASTDGVAFRWEDEPVVLHLRGRFNVENALAAAAAARQLGVPPAAVAEGLAAVSSVPGRFEIVDVGQLFTVVVDYAHTPDGLEEVLGAARELTSGRVIVVFGAGGDRDAGKRPLMGRIASQRADIAVITSDNPRSEYPPAILKDILNGISGPGIVSMVEDRAAAIALAIDRARPGDVVVIAGKGHETGQDVGGVIQPFDDRAVARDVLVGRMGESHR